MASDDDKVAEINLDTLIDATVAQTTDSDDAQPDMDLDDPEAWLEQMLNDDLALDIDMEPPPIKPSEDAVFAIEGAGDTAVQPETDDVPKDLVETAIEIEPEPEPEAKSTIEDLSDDPEALLAQLLSDDFDIDVEMQPPAIKPSEDAVYVTGGADSSIVEDDTPPEPEADLVLDTVPDEIEAVESDIISDVPEDPDEAMAWLEQLAAQQGAAIEELPSVSDTDTEPTLPSWMAEDLEADVLDDNLAADLALEQDAEVEETPLDEDVSSELPDWLGSADEERSAVGATDWLQSLPEVDMETWLSAEEEATVTGSTEEVILPDTGPLSAPPQMLAEEEIADDLFEPVSEPLTGAYSVDEAQLTVAQDALADGRLDEAISQYKQLVTAGSGMMTIISELEQAAEANPEKPAFYQVLGDAYMRNGQLQKALASYRSALDQM